MKLKQALPFILLAAIIGPAAIKAFHTPEAPPAAAPVRAPEPRLPEAPATPEAWFDGIRARCTPAEVRLATDLRPPPDGPAGTGFEAACFALARQIPTARAHVLSLPEAERLEAAARVYDVGQRLVGEGRQDVAGPLMELVLEFWPNHYLALYAAGTARYAEGDTTGAREPLAHFLDVYTGNDDLTANARRIVGDAREAER